MKQEYHGLSSLEAAELLKKNGKNEIADKETTSLFKLLLSQYTNIITVILICAGSFSLFLHEQSDAFFIFLILLLNGLFGFVQQYRAEKTLEKLKDLSSPLARVVRDGQEKEIEAKLLVPGDLVSLREGDRIPADGILLTTVHIEIDESLLTGESMTIEKQVEDKLFMGTFLVQGKGYMKIEAIGFQTELGKIATAIKKIKRPTTPLARDIDDLGKKLAFVGIFLAAILVPVGVLQGREFSQLLLTVVSVAVAVIPEGLPLVVTVALAVGAHRLAQNKTIVRKMSSIETLGATTAVLSDKTGTITQNMMSVKTHWLASDARLPLLLRSCVLGNTASLVDEEDGNNQEIIGDKTDGAMLLFAKQHVKNFEEYKNEGKVLSEKPFNPETKLISVDFELEGKKIEFVRGAPESVFRLTNISKDGEAYKEMEKMAKRGLRVVAFASKEKKEHSLIGLLGIYDPPREEAKEAILQASKAGIRVVMVTGDNPQTARFIAEEVGLIKDKEIIFTTDELQKTTDEELLKLLPTIRIFARMRPEDKQRLVGIYKKAGYIVAVTGDGVNDALALSEAHIGVSMGKTGTDVAKEASDIVITDDNLFTIVKAIEEGRSIFENIVKVVVFLISSNITEFLLIFISIIIGLPIPLTASQILWVNLVGDGLPALALSVDVKGKNLLLNKPRNVRENILNFNRILRIAKITVPFALLLMIIYYVSLQYLSHENARFVVFNALVIGEMGIVFLIRRGIRPISWFLIFSIVITLLIQLFLMVNPYLRGLLS